MSHLVGKSILQHARYLYLVYCSAESFFAHDVSSIIRGFIELVNEVNDRTTGDALFSERSELLNALSTKKMKMTFVSFLFHGFLFIFVSRRGTNDHF